MKLLHLGRTIEVLANLYQMENEPDATFTVEGRAYWRRILEPLVHNCKDFDLAVSAVTLDRLMAALDDPGVEPRWFRDLARTLRGRLGDELGITHLLRLGQAETTLYRERQPFGHEVGDAFPSAAFDIEEAAKCRALERYTASCFHLMRAAEVGLRALGISLKDPSLDPKKNPTWDRILSRSDAELKKPLADRTPEWRSDEQFYSAAAANLRAVKDAWRNPTVHVEMIYDEGRSEDVWHAIRAFMRHLATKLKDH